ncbi:hypothetical protein OOZ19_02615 [Saccharopolyspora sp. NFXS83]|uniref:hypothetical protein n=1 Tax=Saccharopolyspora sp. NFXS83 TaxID=2993560 RepID=UPI00224B0252|nr:hypothetical protein [Saccharopolyspora sp. NFXS83]MCX2729120.1 hypothetical protein [Saccharopolyspora sp. NFXS83]
MSLRKQVDPHLARSPTAEPVQSRVPLGSGRRPSVEVRPSGRIPPATVMHLQRTLGNMTVARMLQPPDTAEQSLRTDGITTMGGLLAKLEMPISKYRIPDDAHTKVADDRAKIDKFNERLDTLAAEAPFDGSFTVDVMAGDLPGSGDYMAGAKLARALAEFYSFIAEWKNVKVRLYVGRLDSTTATSAHKDSVRREVTDVLGKSGAELYDGNGEKAEVTVGYPVSGGHVDLTVAQYGFDQFGLPEFDQYGSGPGFGSLGVLPVPEPDRQAAITAANEANARGAEEQQPPSTMMAALNDLKSKHGLAGFHFAYYSTFDHPVKPFVTNIVDSINNRPESADSPENPNVGIAFSKPAKGLDSAAAAVRAKPGWQVVRYSISRNETTIETTPVNPPAPSDAQGGGKKTSKKAEKRAKGKTSRRTPTTATPDVEAEASSAPADGRHVLVLVEFPAGVHPTEMLSLYHSSLSPAGATGDQSFMEAYQMMAPNTEIRYDVEEHQRKLYRHIEELNAYDEHRRLGTTGSVMTKAKEANKTVVSVPVDPERKLVQKNLLHPMLLLINEKLQQQQRDA